jgi:phosphonate degradation associated HDIG domain protein
MSIIDEVFALLAGPGASKPYGLNRITQLAHAVQTGWLAEQAGAPATLITACLLHDVGHLISGMHHDPQFRDADDRHEELAANWLGGSFPAEVTEPIRLHVAAKRYLCWVDPAYAEMLTKGSARTLAQQGGAFTAHEAAAFAARPHAAAAIHLRRWDEGGKRERVETPDLGHFRRHLEAALLPAAGAAAPTSSP